MRRAYLVVVVVCFILVHKGIQAQCPDVNASFTTSQTDICGPGPQTISFINTSSGANSGTATYEWFLNGTSFDITAGLAAPSNSNISAVGVYNYMLVATDATVPCTDTAFVTVYIYPTPNSSFTFGPNNACAGTTISYNGTATGTWGGTTYLWNFGDGNNANTENATHQYGAGGSYTISYLINNGPGCTSNSSQNISVMDIPNVSIAGDDGDGDLVNCLLPADPSTSEMVTFSNFTTGGVSYTWDFGDGSPPFTTGSTAPFTHDYTSFGTYMVTMTATHANGCTATDTLTVVFEKYVSAAMTLDITEYSGCAPHDLSTLTNLSVNANSYVWDFGDGTVITTTSSTPPAHSYLTEGTYTISLTAINSCNQANATISPIIIIDGPTANFSTNLPFGGGTIGCAPQNMDVTNLSQDAQPINNYYWDMGNGNTYTNTITPPTQNYDTTGVYTIMLVAGNACGPDTMILDITIDTVPVIDITSIPLDGCSPLTVQTANNSYTNPINYSWFVDGVFITSAQNLPDQTFINTGSTTPANHTIQLNGSNICGSDSDQEMITVHPETEAIFTISDDTICVGESITFTDGSFGEALTFDWDFGIQAESTQGPHTITYNSDGNYTIELIVDGFCGSDTATVDIVVLPYPVADFTVDVDSGCVDFDVTITNNSTLGGNYTWAFNGGTPANSIVYAPAPVNYSSPGTYTVILDVDVLGCINSDTVVIESNPLPLPAFTVTPVSGCTPLDVAFSNTSPVNPGDVFDWDLGNGTSFTGQNPLNEVYVAASNDSVYTVQLIITSAEGCIDSVEQTITVHPLPVADYTPLPDTTCAGDPIAFLNNSIGASSYQWDFGDGNSSTQTSPAHPYTQTGDIITQLVAITTFGCTDTLQVPVYVDSIPTANFSFDIVCDIDTTHFTDLSSGAPTQWEWDFGDASPLSNDQDPNYFYGVAGSYNVILTVTNPAGCTNSINQLVDVSLVPVADFVTNPTCLTSPTIFTDITSGIPTSWQWDFGDGAPINTNQNPTHVYGDTGTYNVTLIAQAGNGCSDTTTMPITVTPIPTADFSFVSVCTGDVTAFTDQSLGNPDTWYWDFGDGNTDNTNNPNPTHIFSTAGTYNVMLVAGYAASGCTDTIIYTVDAHPLTTPAFTTNTPCLGGSTSFTDFTGGTPNQWEWTFGDGSPVETLQNPVHVYSTPGIFNVQLITENTFGCSDTLITTVEVYPLPTADFAFTTVCLNATTNFTDSSTSAVAWEWNFGDGSPLSNLQSPSHIYNSSGNFDVQLVVTNVDGCTDTSVQTVTVNPNPIADFSATTACHTYPTFFSDSSSGAVSYYWDFGDVSPIDSAVSPVYTYASSGSYLVEMIVVNVFGCTDTAFQNVDVLVQPQAGFTNSNVCAGESVLFTDTSTLGPSTWQWDFGDGSPLDNVQNPVHLFNPGGIYNVTLIVGNIAGCMDTTVVPVNVYTVPVPNFTADTVCLFSVTTFTDLTVDSAPLATWDWDFDDGNTSFQQNPTYIFQTPGQFDVELIVTNVNGCDSSITLPVHVSDIPVANFTTDTVCLGNPTTFTDVSTGSPDQWTWTFGDGNSSNIGPVTQHTYNSPGSYIASLLVTAGGICQDQVFQLVEVIDNVQADFTSQDSLCDGSTFNFVDNSTITLGAIVGYAWDFGDGNTANTQNANHTYATPGTYTVTHTVYASGGCSQSVTADVTVMDVPSTLFLDLQACQNNPTVFSDLSSINNGTISSWIWDFGDGSPVVTNQNPVHTFMSDGNYNVTLTVISDLGCSNSVVIPTIVYPAPVANFTSPLSCPDDTVQYTDQSIISSGTIVDWLWDFDDGGNSTVQHPQHQFQVLNDSFYVELVVTSNFGCTDTTVQLVQTYPFPYFQYGPDWTAGCQPLVLQFNDSSTVVGGVITNWEWYFDDGSASYAEDPIHIFANEGTYYVGMSVTTSQGCTFVDSLAYPVIVYPKPNAGFDPVYSEISILTPEVQFTDLSFDAVNWEWYFGDGNYSNNQHPLHEYSDTGFYQVMQIVYSDFGCTDTAYGSVKMFGEYAIFVPNTFTPNGDSKNQYFRAYGMAVDRFDMRIFNRWGEQIWQTEDINDSWDGTYNGVLVQDDVYVWKIVAYDTNGNEHELYGHVTVLK
ncbi:MAG: PKD domain-containing protein [Crocinitomicaceae bacterium]|nr:PKD domain-containing protein [Crocinitomicaceae bacterium]